jgi:hypothetical protein
MDPFTLLAIGFGSAITLLAKKIISEFDTPKKIDTPLSPLVNQIARSIESGEPGWHAFENKHVTGHGTYTVHKNTDLNIAFAYLGCNPQIIIPYRQDLTERDVEELKQALQTRAISEMLSNRMKLNDSSFAEEIKPKLLPPARTKHSSGKPTKTYRRPKTKPAKSEPEESSVFEEINK